MNSSCPNPPDLQVPQIPPLSVCGGLVSPYRIDPEPSRSTRTEQSTNPRPNTAPVVTPVLWLDRDNAAVYLVPSARLEWPETSSSAEPRP